MNIQIRKAQPEDAELAAVMLADTMSDFGVATLGLGHEALELKALRIWFANKGNRFSHEFCWLAMAGGEPAGLLLTLRGDQLGNLEKAMANGIFQIYWPLQILRMLWRLMVLGRTDEASGEEFLVSHLAVRPEFRRQGIGMQLLQIAEEQAREQKFSRLVLEVEIDNHKAKKLYEKFGFVCIATTEFRGRAKVLACPGYHKMLKQL
jgi:GNAT superfamily N-acetyltransferase